MMLSSSGPAKIPGKRVKTSITRAGVAEAQLEGTPASLGGLDRELTVPAIEKRLQSRGGI